MKKNEQIKKLVLEQLRKTPILEAACQKVDISRMTFYRWKQDDAEFAKAADEAILAGRFLVNDLAESQLIGAIKERSLPATTYWLKHHHPSYKTRIEIEAAINPVHELTPEQQETVKEALRLASLAVDEGTKEDNKPTNL